MIMEVWRNIKNHEDKYQVSNLGNFRRMEYSIDRGEKGVMIYRQRKLKPFLHKEGWLYVELDGVSYKAHRLVLSAFVENTENKRTVNHKNGIKTDNRLENLEWATDKEQHLHARNKGLFRQVRGEQHGKSIFTNIDIVNIREQFNQKNSMRSIAKKYKTDHSTISNIIHKKTWNHV